MAAARPPLNSDIEFMMSFNNRGCGNAVWRLLTVTCCAFGLLAVNAGAAEGIAPTNGLTVGAQAQIAALMAEKASFTPEQLKMDSQLVFAWKRSQNLSIAGGAVPLLRLMVAPDNDGFISVDITAKVSDALLALIQSSGGTIQASHPNFNAIRAKLPIGQIPNIASFPDVIFIKPAVKRRLHTDSEGDVTQNVLRARALYGLDGTGVNVGVISDSVDYLTTLQGQGLMGPVKVLPGQSGIPGTGEGTAMLQIVHDLAPGSSLFFATADPDEATFAQNILNLRSAGCSIICDDVGFFDESPFQDGIVAQAVNSVTASGALYFSAAGNSGNFDSGAAGTFEGDFVSGGTLTGGKGGALMAFGAVNWNVAKSGGGPCTLFWTDPLGSSTNDYDLYIFDAAGANVLASSVTVQNGTQDPYEIVGGVNPGELVVVVLANGTNRFIHLDCGGAVLTDATGGNTKGHNCAANAFDIAAVPIEGTFPSSFTGGYANPVESFSSDGQRRVFFRANGTPYTPGNYSSTGGVLRRKPDLAGSDGVTTDVPGFAPFYGTSAATPHVTAIAALVQQYNPDLSEAQTRAVLTGAALDIMAPGYDRDSGYGIVMADATIAATPVGVASPHLILTTNYITGGNGNGAIDPNECNNLYLVFQNKGLAAATDLQVTLSSTTPGVSFGQPTSFYGTVQPGQSATNTLPFLVSTSPNFICGTPVTFQIAIKSDQNSTTNFFSLNTGTIGTPVRFDNTNSIAIPDNNTNGVDSVINVTGVSAAIYHLTVALDINHPRDSDLAMQLIGPDGTVINLARNVGGRGASFGLDCSDQNRTYFDDSAMVPIGNGTAPFVGEFQPLEPLAAFSGKSGGAVNGNWRLHVVDGAASNVGQIGCWSLIMTTAACTNGSGPCPGVDLGITMTTSPQVIYIGGMLSYTMVISNAGPDTAQAVALSQTLDSSVQFVSAVASQGVISPSGGGVSGNLGSLSEGSTATVTINVLPLAAKTIFSTATVGYNGTDSNPLDNSVTVGNQINPSSADLALGIVANPSPALLDGVLTYTISVTNNGPSRATSVMVSNALPAAATFLSAGASQGVVSNSNGSVLANLGGLDVGASATMAISVRPTSLGVLTDTVKVSGNQLDPVPANNSATVTTTVSPAAQLLLNMVGTPAAAIVGSNVTYQLSVYNQGPSAATGVVVADQLPTGATLVSATNFQGATVVNGSIVTCTVSNLAVGATASMKIVVGTAGFAKAVPTNIVNSASVSSAQAEPDASGTHASVSTLVAAPNISVVAAGSTLVSVGNGPNNGAINIGQTVTVSFGLQNIGNVPTKNLTATLLGTGGVVTNSPQAKNYGVLLAGGTNSFQNFTFTATGASGGTVVATLLLQDGTNVLSTNTAVFTFALPTSTQFANSTFINILDGKLTGPTAANPYPSVINISGLNGVIGKATVTITNFNHTYSDDVAILLVGPGGNAPSALNERVLLLSHVGGYNGVTNGAITFDDAATAELYPTSGIVNGTYKPSGYGSVAFPQPAPGQPYQNNLSSLNGISPNGAWSLYVIDQMQGDVGFIQGGWALTLTTITPVNQVADLAITGVAVPNPVFLGAYVTNVFSITNSGPNLASGVVVTNPLPVGAAFVSAQTSKGTTGTNANGVVYCVVGNLGTGTNVTFSVVVSPTVGGAATNLVSTATVGANQADLNLSNNVATLNAPVLLPLASLAVTVTGSTNTVVTGSNLSYTITVTNNGPNVALAAAFSDVLPVGLSYVSSLVSPAIGVISNFNGTLSCPLGNLASGAGAAITVQVVPQQLGWVTNTVSFTTVSTNGAPGGAVASAITSVVGPAASIVASGSTLLAGDLVPGNGTVNLGETVTVSLALANVGSADTANLQATLLGSGGVLPVSPGPQIYGALIHGGAAVSQPFTFQATSANNGLVTASLQLNDGETNLGVVSFVFNLPVTNSFANSAGIIIPDNGPGNPYPATINITGLSGLVAGTTVTLSNFNHAFPSDVQVLVVNPAGQSAVLMSAAGGGQSVSNLVLTFADTAAQGLSETLPLSSGVYQPTDFLQGGDYFPPPAASGPYAASLTAFNGSNPNGVWTLYVFDNRPGDAGIIASGWSVNLVTVNPINSLSDLALTASAPVGPLYSGNDFKVNYTITNQGPASASGVTITATLPAGLGYVTSSVPATSFTGGLVFNVGAVPTNGTVTVSLTLNAQPGYYQTAANVSAIQTDLIPGNNALQLPIFVLTTPQFTTTSVANDGSFVLTLSGQPLQSYLIQSSTNLVDWSVVSTNQASSKGILQYQDTNSSNVPYQFYRAVVNSQ